MIIKEFDNGKLFLDEKENKLYIQTADRVVWVRDWDLEDLVSKVVEDSSTLESVEVLTTTDLSKTIIRTVRAGGVRTQTRILRTNEEVRDAMENMAYNQEELEWIKKEVHSKLGIV